MKRGTSGSRHRARAARRTVIALASVGALAASSCAEPPREPSTARPAVASASLSSASSAATIAEDDARTGARKTAGRCGIAGAPRCAAGYQCIDDPADGCDPRVAGAAGCPGVCAAVACGGGTGCASGYDCVDDRADKCDPDEGHARCPGVCVESMALHRCGGTNGRSCPSGERCVDDVADDCNPRVNPTCPGLCVR
jgi:hypothetical protein